MLPNRQIGLQKRSVSSGFLFQQPRVVEVSKDNRTVRIAKSCSAPERAASTTTISLLMIADICGVGVLTLGAAFAELGWVLAAVLLFCFFPLNVATGLMLWEGRNVWPASYTYSDLVRNALGPAWGLVTRVLTYAFIFSFLGDYILSAGLSLGMALFDVRQCLPVWGAVACAAMILPLHQIRSLAAMGWIVWVNVATLSAALLIVLAYLFSTTPPLKDGMWFSSGPTEVVAENLDFMKFWKAASLFAFVLPLLLESHQRQIIRSFDYKSFTPPGLIRCLKDTDFEKIMVAGKRVALTVMDNGWPIESLKLQA